MARTPAPAPAPAPAPQTSALTLAPATDDAAIAAFAEAGIDLAEDQSCSELAPSDFKTAVKLFNLKGKGPDGRQRRQDRFYDSITGEEQEAIEFAILDLHKSNVYAVYDSGEGRTNRICSSFDQITGVWAEDGHTRKCKGCPDKQAVKQPDGKVRANCGEQWDWLSAELPYGRAMVLRGKRTSLTPMKNYSHQHHFGRGGMRNGQRTNMAFYAYRVTATLVMDAGGNYAKLQLERGPLFSPPDLKVLAESSRAIRDTLAERIAEAEAQTDAVSGGDDDDSFEYGDNVTPAASSDAPPPKFV